MRSIAAPGRRWLWVPEEEKDDSRQGPVWGPACMPGVWMAHVDQGKLRAQGERLGVSDMCFLFFKNPFQTAHAEQLIIRWQQVTCWYDEKMLIIQMCPQPFCFNGFISMRCKSLKWLGSFLSCMPVCEVLVCTFGWYVYLSVWLPFVLFFS